MRVSPNSLAGAAALAAVLALSPPLHAQIDIVPQVAEPAPVGDQPPPGEASEGVTPPGITAEPLTGPLPGAETMTPGVEVDVIQEVDPEAAGLFEEAEGGFGVDMWSGTTHEFVERLLPRLPSDAGWKTARSLARRLLLSIAHPPTGRRSTSLIAIRIERLMAMGLSDDAAALMRGLPADNRFPALDEARLNALLLADDIPGACASVRNLIRGADNPYYDMVLAFCQAVNGRHDAAALALGLMQERGVELDAAYLSLLDALAGRVADEVAPMVDPTALHIAMAGAAKQPVPEDAVATASPAIARAIASSGDTPLATRLAAAERAEEAGALGTESLARAYAGVKFTPAAQADPLPRAAADKGPLARALLYQTVESRTLPAARGEALRAAWALARETAGWRGFARIARLHRDVLLKLNPSTELLSIADDVARALLVIDRADVAGDWLELAIRRASVDPEATIVAAKLWPLAKLADKRGALRWSDTRIFAWWKANAGEAEEDRISRASLLFALLVALGEPVPGKALVPLLDAPLEVEGVAPSLALWQVLEQASSQGRIGGTVLAALVALDNAGGGLQPQVVAGVVSNLVRVGLEDEARRLALEIALSSGL